MVLGTKGVVELSGHIGLSGLEVMLVRVVELGILAVGFEFKNKGSKDDGWEVDFGVTDMDVPC